LRIENCALRIAHCLSLHEVAAAVEFVPDELERGDFGFSLLDAELTGVVRVELGQRVACLVALLEKFVVVETAVVGRHAVEVAQVLGLGALLVGQQRLIHLLAVSYADDLDVLTASAEELADCLGLCRDSASRRFLHEDVAVLTVLKGEEYQVDGLVETHDEARHRRLGDGHGIARAYLLDPQRDDRPARAHHVAIARAADLCRARVAALGHGYLLLDGLGDAHRIDGIGRLVGRQTYHGTHASLDSRRQHVVRADDIGLDRLHGEELAARHLLERRRVEDVVHARHHVTARLEIAHVADIELDLVGDLGVAHLILVAHIVLLLLVAAEDADLLYVRVQKPTEHRIAKRARAPRDQKSFVFKY